MSAWRTGRGAARTTDQLTTGEALLLLGALDLLALHGWPGQADKYGQVAALVAKLERLAGKS
jgi:hypothetical protein